MEEADTDQIQYRAVLLTLAMQLYDLDKLCNFAGQNVNMYIYGALWTIIYGSWGFCED